MIRFRNTKNGPRDKRFLRGYGFQGGGDARFNFRARRASAPRTRRRCCEPVTTLGLGGFGECLARFENFVEIDPSGQVDVFGIPILKFHMAWGDNEKAMIADMAESAAEMLEAAGAKNIQAYVRPIRARATGSTRWAAPAWGRTRRNRCSTRSSRRTTSGTCS